MKQRTPKTSPGVGTLFVVVLVAAAACTKTPADVEKQSCSSCHASQAERVARSHHGQGQREVDGGYELGVEPLVQLAVQLPDGRVQVSPRARLMDGGVIEVPHALGGAAGDWKTPSFSWAGSCAPCHATGFQLGTDSQGALHPKWQSLHVECEACHGDAAGHRSWLSEGRKGAPRSGFAFAPGEEVCAACHARRRPVEDEGRASEHLLDRFEPALLTDGLFWPDGRARDEVFEYGPFAMSRMHGAGVRCATCHEPHSAGLRMPAPALCRSCHPGVHDEAPRAGTCVGCHMPETTFLGVDVRHDHRFPSVKGGEQTSDFYRASKVAQSRDAEEIRAAASSTSDLLRYGAALAGAPLLDDPRLAIRVAAARSLKKRTPELERAEQLSSFRGDGWLNRAALAPREEAERLLREGLRVDPTFAPLAVNLADVLRGREDEALQVLERVRNIEPWVPDVEHARGLALVRAGRKLEALRALEAGAAGSARRTYVYLVALRELEGEDAARRRLTAALAEFPQSAELLESAMPRHR